MRTYSGGMRRRLDLGASLVGAPRLLLLDEPTTGLDPRSRVELWDAIRALVDAGTDVLLTTQYLEEADQLADRIVIVDKGRGIADGHARPSSRPRPGSDVIEIHARERDDLAASPAARAHRRRGAPDRPPTPAASPSPSTTAPQARRGRAPPRPAGDRHRRPRPAPPDPRRGVPRPHRRDATDATADAPPTPPTRTSMTATTVTARPPSRAARGHGLPARHHAGRRQAHGARSSCAPPQLIVVSSIQGAMFLLIFRYVFGGAIDAGTGPYVDFLVPGFVVTGALFSGMGAAAGVADDIDKGFFDRLRSLPVPAPRCRRAVAGRHRLVTWGLAITIAIGFAHRLPPARLRRRGAARLRALRRLRVRLHVGVHLHRPLAGSAQAAQGMSLLVFPFTFVSSAYVPVETMPGWMQPIAEHQPITAMIGAVRSLVARRPGGRPRPLRRLVHGERAAVVVGLIVACSPPSPSPATAETVAAGSGDTAHVAGWVRRWRGLRFGR